MKNRQIDFGLAQPRCCHCAQGALLALEIKEIMRPYAEKMEQLLDTVVQMKLLLNDADPPLSRLLSTEEVCNYVCITERTLNRKKNKGWISAVDEDAYRKFYREADAMRLYELYHRKPPPKIL